jgi:hypothetical protein
LRLFGGYMEGFGPDRTLDVADAPTSRARIISLGTQPTGPGADDGDIFSYESGLSRLGHAARIGGRSRSYLDWSLNDKEASLSTDREGFHLSGAPLLYEYCGSQFMRGPAQTVRFAKPMPNNAYTILLTPSSHAAGWRAKTKDGFVIAGAPGDTVDWLVVRRF